MLSVLRYFHPLEQLRRKRTKYIEAEQLPDSIKQNLEVDIPEISAAISELDFIILDFETTGLDSSEDLILSIGWVEMSNNKIELATGQHLFINSDSQIKPETAVINHITPQMLTEGVSLHEAIDRFFAAAAGKIVVAHGCVVEESFLNHYLHKQYQSDKLPLVWVDTMRIEKQLAKAINQDSDIDVTLSGSRRRYELPEYQTHNALLDSVATAELLLAISKRIDPKNALTIGTLYKLSH
ncbi:3'-5' exonuclease [Vibrio sp. WXL103]|uniref:3'-5' exonuclease n=1 Tax=unclassified Vibrio TaxID=2614977 RepID=UPI003EC931BB